METYIGERLGAVESRTRWNIVDGKIVPEGVGVPMETIILNGVNYRRSTNERGELNGNPVDFQREGAEFEGFLKTQDRLTDPNTKVGAVNISVSLPGGVKEPTDSCPEGGVSDYQRNFVDVFIVREDEGGRYIEAVRYLSDLDAEGFREKMAPFKTFDHTPSDTDFLSDPIQADGVFEDPAELRAYLTGGIQALEAQRFAEIKDLLKPYALSYIEALINNPFAVFDHNLRLNAYLNEADNIHGAQERNDQRLLLQKRNFVSFAPKAIVEQAVQILGRQRVRSAVVPCPGDSGGLDVNGDPNLVKDPFSVGDYGKPPLTETEKAKKDPNLCKCLGKDTPHFHCPGKSKRGNKCDSVIVVGQGISSCSRCGEGKKC
jgi:hypothetical protein